MAYYKVLTWNHKGAALNKYTYTPNKWSTPIIKRPVICKRGYHVATFAGLSEWVKPGCLLYIAETKGSAVGRFRWDKKAFSSIKITQRIPITSRKINRLALAWTKNPTFFEDRQMKTATAEAKLNKLLQFKDYSPGNEAIFLKIMLGEKQ